MKTKIVLDADVIIHFAKGGLLHELPNIFKKYEYVVLETVYREILKPTRTQLDNNTLFFNKISIIPFSPKGEMLKEYARLSAKLGRGESACMAFCRFNNDVIGSSNLKDIKDYCSTHKLTYLTTIDFLYYAVKQGIITVAEANNFVEEVRNSGSILPKVNFEFFVSDVVI